MQYLFTAQGDAALVAILSRRPLIALDFDGTLADIVDRPGDARIAPELSSQLAELALHLPVAIVTGRSIDDVKGRLGFTPLHIVGNHGAEDGVDHPAAADRVRQLDPLRSRLDPLAGLLSDAGVRVEDKGQSMALHYRLAPDPVRARAVIDAALHGLGKDLRTFAGKMVVNVVPVQAPDKAVAVRKLVQRCATNAALFAGDDVNDEPVFVSAPAHWLTIRVGFDCADSHAHYFIDEPGDMRLLFARMLMLLKGGPPVERLP